LKAASISAKPRPSNRNIHAGRLESPLGQVFRMPPGTARCVERAAFRNLVREGAVTLYGFATGAEKQAFDLLTRVQHVGPIDTCII
jgi:hypothetical protein